MDQNPGRAALNLFLQAGEFLFESLAARPLSQSAEHQKHQLHHETLRCHNGGLGHPRPLPEILECVRRLDVKLLANHHHRLRRWPFIERHRAVKLHRLAAGITGQDMKPASHAIGRLLDDFFFNNSNAPLSDIVHRVIKNLRDRLIDLNTSGGCHSAWPICVSSAGANCPRPKPSASRNRRLAKRRKLGDYSEEEDGASHRSTVNPVENRDTSPLVSCDPHASYDTVPR